MNNEVQLNPQSARIMQEDLVKQLRANFADWQAYLSAGKCEASVNFELKGQTYKLFISSAGSMSVVSSNGGCSEVEFVLPRILIEAAHYLPVLEKAVLKSIEEEIVPIRKVLENFPKPTK